MFVVAGAFLDLAAHFLQVSRVENPAAAVVDRRQVTVRQADQRSAPGYVYGFAIGEDAAFFVFRLVPVAVAGDVVGRGLIECFAENKAVAEPLACKPKFRGTVCPPVVLPAIVLEAIWREDPRRRLFAEQRFEQRVLDFKAGDLIELYLAFSRLRQRGCAIVLRIDADIVKPPGCIDRHPDPIEAGFRNGLVVNVGNDDLAVNGEGDVLPLTLADDVVTFARHNKHIGATHDLLTRDQKRQLVALSAETEIIAARFLPQLSVQHTT